MHQMAYKAYGDVINRVGNDKSVELRLFGEITRALSEIAEQESPDPAPWADAIDRNLQLWTLLSVDLLDPANALPDETKKSLLTLSEMVRRLSYKVLSGTVEISELVEINKIIMRGLSGDTGTDNQEVAA